MMDFYQFLIAIAMMACPIRLWIKSIQGAEGR